MAITFVVKIVRLKVYIIFSQSEDLALHSRSQLHLKLDKYLICTIIVVEDEINVPIALSAFRDKTL